MWTGFTKCVKVDQSYGTWMHFLLRALLRGVRSDQITRGRLTYAGRSKLWYYVLNQWCYVSIHPENIKLILVGDDLEYPKLSHVLVAMTKLHSWLIATKARHDDVHREKRFRTDWHRYGLVYRIAAYYSTWRMIFQLSPEVAAYWQGEGMFQMLYLKSVK